MFVELMPLPAGRTVLITVAKVDSKTLRVNVIPMKRLTTIQLSVHRSPMPAPPEELDAELGKHLAGYVQTHQQTASTLAEAKATMEAAAKAGQEEAKRKADERKRAMQKPPAKGTAPSPRVRSGAPKATWQRRSRGSASGCLAAAISCSSEMPRYSSVFRIVARSSAPDPLEHSAERLARNRPRKSAGAQTGSGARCRRSC
jgi:PRTRC genetic system protein E